jgi:hypothetical protein
MIEMMVWRHVAFFVAPILVAGAAHAETYPDCEKFDEPLAYNQCLASHGPSAAHALGATEEGGGAGAGVETRGLQVGHPLHHGHDGRMSATFTIEDARPAYQHGGFRRRQ